MSIVNDVPDSLFSLPLFIGEPSPLAGELPRFYRDGFDIRDARLGDSEQGCFIAAIAKERPTVMSCERLRDAFASISTAPIVICWDRIDPGMKRIFASEGIAYIKDADNALLPFMGAVISSDRPSPPPDKLSPQAQRMLINLLNGTWSECNASMLATLSGKSNASVTKYLSEIRAIAPALVSSEGKNRILRLPDGITRQEVLEAFLPYLSSPVTRTHRIATRIDPTILKNAGARLAGESALAALSDLSEDPTTTTVMMDADDIASLAETMGAAWREAPWYEDAPLIIEEWSYPIDTTEKTAKGSTAIECVDAFSLYAALASSTSDDVRLSDAIEHLKELACQK